jgi:hypothetical protein
MVELAIILPLMILLFLGSWTAADLIADNDTALQATRAGARFAAELGNTAPSGTAVNCTPLLTNDQETCTVDMDIINQMLPIVNGKMPNAVVKEIDIYEPNGGGGVGNPGCTTFSAGTCPPNNGAYSSTLNEPINVYTVSGTTVTAPTIYASSCVSTPIDCYTLGQRYQTQPDESELGVRIVFSYTSPSLRMFTWTADTQYTVLRLSP